MSCAIFTVFYGLPMSTGDDRSDELNEFIGCEPAGMHTRYSGSACETPAAFGIPLDRFDECSHHIDLSTVTLVPTALQQKEFTALFDALSPEDQALLKTLGEPRVFFLVSTS